MVERDEVETIIVKDLSRLGREYLQVGQYTEIYFPEKGVRFIAVNDGVDSLVESSNDFNPIRNWANELHAKDTSKKVRAIKKMQAERGERLGGKPPYGYKKKDKDSKEIIPDEETAPIVRQIFDLCAAGKGPNQIARILTREQVLNPTNQYYQATGAACTNLDTTRPYTWSGKTVAKILENKVYIGHTLNMKKTTLSYKNKKQIQKPESEQILVENTHEPLISMEVWEIVQDVRAHKRRPPKHMEEPNLFSGLVYCADCGKYMVLCRTEKMREDQYYFRCSTYSKRGKTACSPHQIREADLKAIVLDDLRRVTHFARMKERQFAQYINQRNTVELRREINRLQKDLDSMHRRYDELSALFKRLYEDNVLGRVSDEQFRMLSADYNAEQKNLSAEQAASQKKFQQSKADFLSMKSRQDAAAAQLSLLGVQTEALLKNGIQPLLEVKAPISGYAANVAINIGKYINPGEALCELIDKSSPMLCLTTYEKDLADIQVGSPVQFRVNGMGTQTFHGIVISIGQKVDETNRSLEVYASIKEENVQFRPGMYVTAHIQK